MRTIFPLSICALSLALALADGLQAQTATDANLGSTLSADSSTIPPTYTFSWWGRSGFNYVIETNPDLLSPWVFLPNHNPSGADAALAVQFTTDSDRYFLRVTQFDPNDVPSSADSDGDGLPDKWERYFFGDLSRDGSGDWNNDGLLDRDAFRFGLDPKATADESQTAGKFDAFHYDARGWLDGLTITGSPARTLTLDKEGNIEAAN
ncbi:MAG: hypothetical protein RIQ79_898 [Verrucomicrobiota bacterium]